MKTTTAAQQMLTKDDPRRKVAIAEIDTLGEKSLVLWKLVKNLKNELNKKETINEDLMFDINTALWKGTEKIADLRKQIKILTQKLMKAPALKIVK